jgi:tellurite resistance protein TerB
MGFKEWLTEQKNNTVVGVKKFANKDFMEAVAAGCAMIAYADGSIDSVEKQKMVGFINLNDALKVFKLNDILARFNHYVEMFEFDLSVGKTEAMSAISKLKKNTDAAKILITVCCAIGASDGNFDNNEKTIVKEMCQALGLDSSKFELK